MARINLNQAINLNFIIEKQPKTVELKRGVNDLDAILKTLTGVSEAEVLKHPYILAHIKDGSVSIIPDPMDPEAVAAAAEEIARRARAEAEAAKALKAAEQKKVEETLKTAALRQDGPTIAEFVAAGYKPSAYPPAGYASKSPQEEIDAWIAADRAHDDAPKTDAELKDAEAPADKADKPAA